MNKILMCGPLSLSGGVSNHTKYLNKHLSLIGKENFFLDFINNNFSKLKI